MSGWVLATAPGKRVEVSDYQDGLRPHQWHQSSGAAASGAGCCRGPPAIDQISTDFVPLVVATLVASLVDRAVDASLRGRQSGSLLTGREVPDPKRAVRAASHGDSARPVAESQPLGARCGVELPGLRAVGDVPDADDRVVGGGGHQHVPAAAELHLVRLLRDVQCGLQLARCCVPHADVFADAGLSSVAIRVLSGLYRKQSRYALWKKLSVWAPDLASSTLTFDPQTVASDLPSGLIEVRTPN
jgi:hypothetical protein